MNYKQFRNNRLFVKPRFLKFSVVWEWTDIALCFRIYQQSEFSDHHIGIDIQVLWLNVWIECFRK